MRRILREGGVLRISVPDFEHILAIYEANDRDIAAIEQPLMGGQDYPFNYHYAVFNDAHLRAMAQRSGFRETRSWDPASCDHHDFEDWASMTIPMRGRDFPISLNIEAVK
jgi:predicted SAM-dependent methyltransferase